MPVFRVNIDGRLSQSATGQADKRTSRTAENKYGNNRVHSHLGILFEWPKAFLMPAALQVKFLRNAIS